VVVLRHLQLNDKTRPGSFSADQGCRHGVVPVSKVCRACNLNQPLDDFPLHPRGKDGRTAKCKRCTNGQRRERRASNPEYRNSNYIFAAYGVTKEWYDNKLADQGGLCAICGLPPTPGIRLCIDHDHACCPGRRSCGKCVRGLLHTKCNASLGSFGDSVTALRLALNYLESYKCLTP
jgi:hypothetical protein